MDVLIIQSGVTLNPDRAHWCLLCGHCSCGPGTYWWEM